MPELSTRELIAQYGGRLDPLLLTEHAVASPAGLWLLVALVAPAAKAAAHQDLEAVLGADADDAARRAAQLLTTRTPRWQQPQRSGTGSSGRRTTSGRRVSQALSNAARCRARPRRMRGPGSGRTG